MNAPNAQYNVASPGSLPVKIAGHQRQKMYAAFLKMGIAPVDSILDIGATSDQSYAHSNYLEAWYPHMASITAVGVDQGAEFLSKIYPGVTFAYADGRALPFPDDSFDFVHSSAVLEHVGSRAQQRKFIAEAVRVSRRAVFLTTPNKWFPVEFHTVLPMVHWLPPSLFRFFLTMSGNERDTPTVNSQPCHVFGVEP